MTRICFYALGCKVNRCATEGLSQLFAAEGFLVCPEGEAAEVYVVSSCTVTGQGDRKTRQLLRRLRREHPGAALALTGCYPQAFPLEAQALAEADILTGSGNRAGLVAAVQQFLATGERVVNIQPHRAGEPFELLGQGDCSGKTRSFIQIEDGCENYCAYCIIPAARGPVRSKPLAVLGEELARSAAAGKQEAVLVGINLGSYGRDLGCRLPDAVQLGCTTPGILRLRLGSMEPDLITPEDVARLAGMKALCPQFHLSLQSGSESVLRRMGRRYTPEQYLTLVEALRAAFPGAAFTTDMMVGFPGETEDEAGESLAFARQVGFAKIHTFIYSPRPGTRAASMPGQITSQLKKQRVGELLALGEELRQGFLTGMVGSVQQVLFEGRERDGVQNGYTENYTPVSVREPQRLHRKIKPIRITEVAADGCWGVLDEMGPKLK